MGDIRIINGGLYTTIQDKGRYGYQQYGMPAAGAMDDFALRVANILVGNEQTEACIECTMLGPELQFNTSTVIAVTGANMLPRINNQEVPMWRSIYVNAGDTLTFEFARTGCRSYIAFAGGMNIPNIMGSKSTYVRGCIGGIEGRKLKSNDAIGLNEAAKPLTELINRTIPREFIPTYKSINTVRVILGPQDDYFTDESLDIFFKSEYEITNEADRMGYRLSGPELKHIEGADIISDGIAFGSIQVPGHGTPIIMMSDRQTTGGYTKIATVISTDLPILAQLKPKDKVNFISIDINQAHSIYKEYENTILKIKDYIENNQLNIVNAKRFSIGVSGKTFNVLVEEIK